MIIQKKIQVIIPRLLKISYRIVEDSDPVPVGPIDDEIPVAIPLFQTAPVQRWVL
jgi:hypothetical protein